MKKTAFLFIVLLTILSAHGQGFIYDQQSPHGFVTFAESGAFLTNQPIGQSFTPTLSSIDFVFLQIDDYNWNNGTGAVVFVKLFSGSLTNGTLLGATTPLSLPDGWGATVGGYGETNFFFPTSIALTPGTQYFLRPILQSGDEGFFVGSDYLGYNGGEGYINGPPGSEGQDLWFREGIIAVPEPSSVWLAWFGGAAWLFVRCRRCQ